MRELAVQSANDTNTATDRGELQKEFDQLVDEVDRIAGNTEFNTQNLLGHKDAGGDFDGTAQTFTFHIGANEGQKLQISVNSMDADRLGTKETNGTFADGNTILDLKSTNGTGGGLQTQGDADTSITIINNAIELVSAERSKLGAYQNRLDHTINNLNTSSENLTAAESRIRDVDYALAA